MKKKTLAMALSCALIAVVGIGSTFAYFTDKEEATNKVTMGHVDIDLWEVSGNDQVKGLTFTGVLPGDKIDKQARVTLAEDSADAYVRVKVEAKAGKEDVSGLKYYTKGENGELTEVEVDEQGYILFTDSFKKGAEINVFDVVEIPAEWDNDWVEKTFTIELTAEAVQAQNNDTSFNNVEVKKLNK